MCDKRPPAGRVSFVGAGPGAENLLTVRGVRRIGDADVVVWPAAAIPPEAVRGHAGPDAGPVDCSRYGHQDLSWAWGTGAARDARHRPYRRRRRTSQRAT